MGEAEGQAHLLARSPTVLRLLREVLGLFAAEFETDEDVPGTWAWLDAQTTSEKIRGVGPSAQVVLASGMR